MPLAHLFPRGYPNRCLAFKKNKRELAPTSSGHTSGTFLVFVIFKNRKMAQKGSKNGHFRAQNANLAGGASASTASPFLLPRRVLENRRAIFSTVHSNSHRERVALCNEPISAFPAREKGPKWPIPGPCAPALRNSDKCLNAVTVFAHC